MNKLKYLFFLLFILTFIGGCATSELEFQQNNVNLVWPPPPYKPKIKFIKSISSNHDIGIKKSWLIKAKEFVFGREEIEYAMLRPYGVSALSKKIYVSDPDLSLVHIFDFSEKKYYQINQINGIELLSPLCITADKNGQIFLSDSLLRKVFMLTKEGKFLKEIGASDLFIRPTGITTYENRVYVVDTLRHEIMVFSKEDGQLIFRFGKNGINNGEFHYPTHIFTDRDGLIYITDSLNFRIQIFDSNGNFISSFGKLGDAFGDFSKPKGVAVDSEGNIYVIDSQFDNIQIFDKNGNLLLVFGGSGRSIGKFSIPAGIYIDDEDFIYVADSYNRRIQVFKFLKSIN